MAAEATELLLHGTDLAGGGQKVVHLPLERREASTLACDTVVAPDVARAGTSLRRTRWHFHHYPYVGSSCRRVVERVCVGVGVGIAACSKRAREVIGMT